VSEWAATALLFVGCDRRSTGFRLVDTLISPWLSRRAVALLDRQTRRSRGVQRFYTT
jgi:hypothetical protein